jgi:FkbM family methyltransferase
MSTLSEMGAISHVNILQVGAHVGHTSNDPIFNKPMKDQTLIVIEPVPYLFQQLVANYEPRKQDNRIECLNIAVSNTDGSLKLYVPSASNDFNNFPFWASQLASTNPVHISTHLSGLQTEAVEVPCYRLNTLIKTLGIERIDSLMVDTEGHDYEILMDLDLSVVKPGKIRFENKHMDGVFVRGTRYTTLMNHFSSNGYVKTFEDHEDTVIERTE